MDKDDDYKNRSVVFPIAIFIVFMLICIMIAFGNVLFMWGIKSAYDELGRNSMSSSVQQKSSEEIQLEEKVLDRGNYSLSWTTDEIINLQIKNTAAGQTGASLDEVLEKHGKATDFFYSEIDDNVELTYFSEAKQDHHRSNLSLTFEKMGQTIILLGRVRILLMDYIQVYQRKIVPISGQRMKFPVYKFVTRAQANPVCLMKKSFNCLDFLRNQKFSFLT